MEERKQILDSDKTYILEFKSLLESIGIIEDSQYYYVDSNYKEGCPFFKISKKYKKEKPTDPEIHYIFVDVEETKTLVSNVEYSVYGNYCHEHFSHPEKAVELIKGLLDDSIVEIALIHSDRMASLFYKNTNNHEENIKVINNNGKYIMERLFNDNTTQLLSGGHLHEIFPASFTNNILYNSSKGLTIKGLQVFLVSAIFSCHPEFYIVQ